MSENVLSPDGIAAVDKSALLGDILAIPDHISDAMWRAESAMLEPGSANSLVVCGMGGSAIGADLGVSLQLQGERDDGADFLLDRPLNRFERVVDDFDREIRVLKRGELLVVGVDDFVQGGHFVLPS